MALDGSFLKHIKAEIEQLVGEARVDKIHQPTKEEVVVGFRYRGGSSKLFISSVAGASRIHFTNIRPENPHQPPMFCMLMRKHIGSAKLVEVKQIGLDRILHMIFQTTNELGDTVFITLAVEIMGRHSNIILINNEGKIIDSIKRVNMEMSSVRQVLPGMQYELPPLQDKICLDQVDEHEIFESIKDSNRPLSKAILEKVQGISPLVAREISDYATKEQDTSPKELDKSQLDRLKFYLKNLIKTVKECSGKPTIVFDKNSKPLEFSYIPLKQYKGLCLEKEMGNFGELMDVYFSERDRIQRMHSRSNDLLKLISNLHERTLRKIAVREKELAESGLREKYKIYGDLLSSNIHLLQKGEDRVKVYDYYSENADEIEIEIDPLLSPSKNIQRYYNEYRKLDTAEKKLRKLIEEDKEDLIYIDSVFDSLTRSESDAELIAIRGELEENSFVKKRGKLKKKPVKLEPKEYLSDDGFTILVGRNNIQNDKLTMKTAKNYDYWFHTKDIPGSHTVVIADSKDIPDSTLEQAAAIAAYHSKARESGLVAVDYTIIKNVKKPNGSKPGMVIYDVYKTAYVTPSKELCDRLIVKK